MGEILKYGKVWGTNESTLDKKAGASDDSSSLILQPNEAGQDVKVLYDNFEHSIDNEIPYENFTINIIDSDTGEYPDWLLHYYNLTSINTPLSSVLSNVYPENTPLGYSWNTWRFITKWNWLQNSDTTARSMEITFTENETSESVTHTLTQEGSLAASKTPLNLQIANFTRPTVNQSVGKVTLTFDRVDTFVCLGYPGTIEYSGTNQVPNKWNTNQPYSIFYKDGNRQDPEWEVQIIDSETGLPAEWITFREYNNVRVSGSTKMAIDFILDFDENPTGRNRYFELTIIELNHNESIDSTTTLPYIISGDNSFGASTYQPNR